MDYFKNKLGDDGINWWVGVVEDRNDPLNASRYKVRIFGSHTTNLEELPTKNLPWAIVTYTPNLGKSFGALIEGTWVTGFFLDGESKQAPVITGVIMSIPQEDIDDTTPRAFSAYAKRYNDPAVAAAAEANTPIVYTDTPAQKQLRPGNPTIPALVYTKQGTGVQKSDDNRAHVCDIRENIRFQEAVQALKDLAIVQAAIRAVQTLTDSTSGSTIATEIRGVIQSLRAFVRTIQKILNFFNDVILVITEYITLARLMIAWILSLPAYLLQMLQDCLATLQNSLLSALSFTVSGGSNTGIISEFKGLVSDVISTTNTAITTVANGRAAAESAQQLANPKSYGKP